MHAVGPTLRHKSSANAPSLSLTATLRFPALFFDNLSSLLGILGVMLAVPFIALSIGATITPAHALAFGETVFGRVGPGIAFALAFGNIWYARFAPVFFSPFGCLPCSSCVCPPSSPQADTRQRSVIRFPPGTRGWLGNLQDMSHVMT